MAASSWRQAATRPDSGRSPAELWMGNPRVLDAGSHRTTKPTSFAAIYATFIPTFITAIIYLVIFVLIRQWYRNIYVPRTYMSIVPEKDRTPVKRPGRFGWVRDLWSIDDKFVLRHQSLDGYLYLRFFRSIIFLSFVGCCITWPILFPVNVTGGGTAEQLDRISFSNISSSGRLYAHALVAWIFLTFVMVLVARERLFAIALRQTYLLSASNTTRLSSRVVLFLSVPDEAFREGGLQRVFGNQAKRGWTVSNLNKLEALVQDRNDKASALETAEIALSRKATKKTHNGNRQNSDTLPVANDHVHDGVSLEEQSRPTHKSLPLVGKEVDTIQELRTVLPEVATLIQNIRDTERRTNRHGSPAMFVEFEDQGAAHRACQQVHHHSPLALWPRYVGVQPKEVLWPNLTLHPSDRIFREYLSITFIATTIIFWSIPIGFIAAISNISYLTEKFHFLQFLNNLPRPILGFLQGFVPPYVVSEVVSYVPKFFRYIAKLTGAPTTPEAEARTQQWYFAFQLIQVFLVTTTASGAAAVAAQLANEPTSASSILAENLPTASNFYLSYFIIQGTASAAKNILNYEDLFEYLFYDYFFDKTPRQQYSRYTKMKNLSWGSVYPKFANMVVIAIAYSCIAPLILGFATVGFSLYYLSYRHNLIYVIQTKIDTKGAAYSRALQHILTGVYLSELCLIGLFGARKAKGPSILMIILLICTVIYHITLNRLISPLERYLPAHLVPDFDEAAEEEETPLLASEEGAESRVPTSPSPPFADHSLILKFGRGSGIPQSLIEPFARFFEPHVFYSRGSLQSWFRDDYRPDDEEIPSYTDEQLENAYVNPALTSKMPKLWLVRDDLGISKREISENEKAGLSSTDEGAWLDEDGKIVWDHEDLRNTPLFKEAVRY